MADTQNKGFTFSDEEMGQGAAKKSKRGGRHSKGQKGGQASGQSMKEEGMREEDTGGMGGMEEEER